MKKNILYLILYSIFYFNILFTTFFFGNIIIFNKFNLLFENVSHFLQTSFQYIAKVFIKTIYLFNYSLLIIITNKIILFFWLTFLTPIKFFKISFNSKLNFILLNIFDNLLVLTSSLMLCENNSTNSNFTLKEVASKKNIKDSSKIESEKKSKTQDNKSLPPSSETISKNKDLQTLEETKLEEDLKIFRKVDIKDENFYIPKNMQELRDGKKPKSKKEPTIWDVLNMDGLFQVIIVLALIIAGVVYIIVNIRDFF